MRTLIITELELVQDGPPVVWSGKLDGVPTHFRYRWGVWSIYTGDASIFSSEPGEDIASGLSGRGEYDGICTWDDFVGWAAGAGIQVAVVGSILSSRGA